MCIFVCPPLIENILIIAEKNGERNYLVSSEEFVKFADQIRIYNLIIEIRKQKVLTFQENIDTNEARLLKELNKCDLICGFHHRIKTKLNEDFSSPASAHGSLRKYIVYKCRCKKCKAAMSEYYYSRLS